MYRFCKQTNWATNYSSAWEGGVLGLMSCFGNCMNNLVPSTNSLIPRTEPATSVLANNGSQHLHQCTAAVDRFNNNTGPKCAYVSWVLKFLIACSALLPNLFIAFYPGFIEIPSSINASLGTTSHFKCTVQGGLPQWRINGRKLSHISLTQREISSTTTGRTSTLSILASIGNNNSAVQCSIDNGTTEIIFSPTVELKVQGV